MPSNLRRRARRLKQRAVSRRIPLRVRFRRGRGRRVRRLFIAFLVLIATLCGSVVVAYKLTVIPKAHPETVTQSTVFLDDKGAYLGRRGPVDRQDVPLAQVPRHVQDAVIAAENRSFRTDTGVSPRAIARAVVATVTGGERQGGSTITQQYVKNALLSPEQSLSRKAREALIAVKLDRTRSKDEILEGYLNTVYFGRGAAGIKAAARNYFDVDPKDLTVSQGAALASIVNIPSYYEKAGSDPKVTAKLRYRWEWVLDAMAASGAISAEQRDGARFPAFRFYPPGATEGQRQYLIDVAAKEAADRLGITEDQLARGGYTVHTTFDLALQDATNELVKEHPGGKGVRMHTAVVAIEPGDGAVRLLYGGSDYARQPFNDAVNGAVEAGTALEPLTRMKLGAPLAQLPTATAPTPLTLASAYAAVAANGRYAAPYTVTKIIRDGRTVHTARPDVRDVLSEKEALVASKLMAGRPLPASPLGLTYPNVFFTGGAGGGITRRTVWSTGYDSQLALTLALFADRPGKHKQEQEQEQGQGQKQKQKQKQKQTSVPAQLPNEPSPASFAEQTVLRIWNEARSDQSR
ncbi:transglycosylase domain-containing protein [Streptomyces cavernae]|uniref:transglycosylase domain-containing protein n=1 Tax=Streptomyces cavernae TaxID=2259034 RepID=UPI000FEB5EA4|nr:transglycosylase domain-containing protein [Streptomyces cavernae]